EVLAFNTHRPLRPGALESYLGAIEDSLDSILASAAADVHILDTDHVGLVALFGGAYINLDFLAPFRRSAEKASVDQSLETGLGSLVVLGGKRHDFGFLIGLDVR